jgi:hypothetical protein
MESAFSEVNDCKRASRAVKFTFLTLGPTVTRRVSGENSAWSNDGVTTYCPAGKPRMV